MNSKRLQSQLLPPECPICLQEYSNKCSANRCLHEFCFKCLHDWSKVRSDCPMCQQPFSSIFCNVKSDREYDECELSLLNDFRPNRCAICLQEFENKCRNNGCQHEFCFGCLHKWSEVIAKCPVCKQSFTSIFHNVQTNGHFDEYKVPILKTDCQSKDMRISGALPAVYRKLERKQVYKRNLWVKPLPDANGRYSNTAPKFFRVNQDSMKRLVPWLGRELACLLIDSNTLPHVQDKIMKVITKHHILSEDFRLLVHKHIGSYTSHFIHEFFEFSRCPFSMSDFDENALYEQRYHEIPSSTSSSDEDEEIEENSLPLDRRELTGGMPTTSSEDTDDEIQVLCIVPARHQAVDTSSSSEEEDQTANAARTILFSRGKALKSRNKSSHKSEGKAKRHKTSKRKEEDSSDDPPKPSDTHHKRSRHLHPSSITRSANANQSTLFHCIKYTRSIEFGLKQ